MIKNLDNAFVNAEKEVIVKDGGVEHKFIVRELSYLSSLNISAKQEQGYNGLALMIAACTTDGDGNPLTYDQAVKLKKEFAEPLWDAYAEVNKLGKSKEKKS